MLLEHVNNKIVSCVYCILVAMATKSTILDAATVLYANDVIDEQDFVCIYENTRRRNPEFQYWNFEKVQNQLDEMTTDESKAEFRFELADLPLLAEAFKIPEKIVCPNRTVATCTEALCIMPDSHISPTSAMSIVGDYS